VQPEAPEILISQPIKRQELEDQLTQEQFDGELENDVDLILTQDQCDEEQERAEGRGEANEGEEEEDDDEDSSGGYESLRILTHNHLDKSQRRIRWT
jgi:hypothetical protein